MTWSESQQTKINDQKKKANKRDSKTQTDKLSEKRESARDRQRSILVTLSERRSNAEKGALRNRTM